MLLDPLSALSLAGTVVQFVDFTIKVMAKGREIYNSTSGSLAVNEELEIVTNDLLRLTERLKESTHPETQIRTLSMDEQALEAIAANCTSIGQELLELLDLLKAQGQKRKWKSFYQAFRTVWKQGEIDATLKRLSSFREELELHLLISIKSVLPERHEFLEANGLAEGKLTLSGYNKLIDLRRLISLPSTSFTTCPATNIILLHNWTTKRSA